MNNPPFPRPVAALAAGLLLALPVASPQADVITRWNALAISATKTGLDGKSGAALNSNLASRIHAIEALAVYDAVNAIHHFGKPYAYKGDYSGEASPGAAASAAAQAAHDVLVALVPGAKNAQVALLDKELASSLSKIKANGASDGVIQAGSDVGKAAAAAILSARADDRSSPNRTYAGPANPGVGEWRPTPVPQAKGDPLFPEGINQQWGEVTPFAIGKAERFAPPPPPKVGSPAYNKALETVKRLGAATNSTRTTDQTHIAQFWKQDAELPVNEAARQLAEQNFFTLEQNAKLFAAVDVAVADARIATWSAKYKFNYWRPVTALNANPDGSVTNGYADWTPLLPTPSHPSYASGHSATVGAGFEVLKAVFGDYQTLILRTTTTGLTPATRTITTLSQGPRENDLSRVYGGIHYRFDDLAGHGVGEKVARHVLKRFW